MGLLIGVGNTKPSFPYDDCYGVEWNITMSNPKLKRIGKMELHSELPLQNMMRNCILDDDGNVVYYLNANDSTKRDTGEEADLTGKDGMMMTELPDMYVRFEMDGNICRHLQSTQPLPGFRLWRKGYVGSVEATVQRSTDKLASVCSTDMDYRGGNNDASLDDTYKTMLGMPATSISLDDFRIKARNRGSVEWNANLYRLHKMIWWLFVVEYCTFNTQDSFDAKLDESGFHQGGLGNGVCDLFSFFEERPVVPCGVTNSLGNHTGTVDYNNIFVDEVMYPEKIDVPRYRGIENPFGHIWKWTDGIKIIIQSEAAGGLSKMYICDDPSKFTNSGVDNYEYRGDISRNSGYVKQLILGEDGDIMPLMVGGGSRAFFCDYFTQNYPSSKEKEYGVMFGGDAWDINSGLVCAMVNDMPGNSKGTRLCFDPQPA